MAVDDRILYLVRQEVSSVLSEAAAGPDDLHAELHALATRVAALEQAVEELGARLSDPATPPFRASRTRKTAGEQSE